MADYEGEDYTEMLMYGNTGSNAPQDQESYETMEFSPIATRTDVKQQTKDDQQLYGNIGPPAHTAVTRDEAQDEIYENFVKSKPDSDKSLCTEARTNTSVDKWTKSSKDIGIDTKTGKPKGMIGNSTKSMGMAAQTAKPIDTVAQNVKPIGMVAQLREAYQSQRGNTGTVPVGLNHTGLIQHEVDDKNPDHTEKYSLATSSPFAHLKPNIPKPPKSDRKKLSQMKHKIPKISKYHKTNVLNVECNIYDAPRPDGDMEDPFPMPGVRNVIMTYNTEGASDKAVTSQDVHTSTKYQDQKAASTATNIYGPEPCAGDNIDTAHLSDNESSSRPKSAQSWQSKPKSGCFWYILVAVLVLVILVGIGGLLWMKLKGDAGTIRVTNDTSRPKTITSHVSYEPEVQYLDDFGLVTNVASMYLGATCTAMNEPGYGCNNAIDGRTQVPPLQHNEWRIPADWYQNTTFDITFSSGHLYNVVAVEVVQWVGADGLGLIRTFNLSADNEQLQTVLLDDVTPEPSGRLQVYYHLDNMFNETRSVTIAPIDIDIKTMNGSIGFVEVKVHGYRSDLRYGGCPDKFTIYNPYLGRCYFVSNSRIRKNQVDAAEYCGQIGGKLLSVRTRAENEFIKPYLNQRFHEREIKQYHIWTALTLVADNWQWSTEEPLGSYDNWDTGQPSNGNETCMEMRPFYWKWNDKSCANKNAFVCSCEAK